MGAGSGAITPLPTPNSFGGGGISCPTGRHRCRQLSWRFHTSPRSLSEDWASSFFLLYSSRELYSVERGVARGCALFCWRGREPVRPPAQGLTVLTVAVSAPAAAVFFACIVAGRCAVFVVCWPSSHRWQVASPYDSPQDRGSGTPTPASWYTSPKAPSDGDVTLPTRLPGAAQPYRRNRPHGHVHHC